MTRALGLVKTATGVRGRPGGRELGAGVGSMFGMGWGVGLGLSLAASQNRDHNIHQNQIRNQNGDGNWSWVLEVPTRPTTSYPLHLHTHTIDSIPIPIRPRAIRKSHLTLSLMICAFKKASWRSHALDPGHRLDGAMGVGYGKASVGAVRMGSERRGKDAGTTCA